MPGTRRLRTYDHRLVHLVQETGDPTLATRAGVPQSTVAGWLRRTPRPVTTTPGLDRSAVELRLRVARLEQRLRRLRAILRLLVALFRTLQPDLTHLRVPHAADKSRLLRAIDCSRGVLGLRRVLRLLRLSPSRLATWRRAARSCELDDASSCPRSSPQRLTADEVHEIRRMVTAPEFRHVPTGRLALLAQRTARVFASPATWYRLVRERGWRRPRLRLHPEGPRLGIRASKPGEIWHIDTTVIRLLDGTRAYLHAVLDNFSRRILAWKVLERFEPASAVEILVQAGRLLVPGTSPPTLLADAGVENKNAAVDELVETGLLKRVLAMTEIRFSNSLIEAWWRTLKHQWLYLNHLDSVAKVQNLVSFYVAEHNTRIPHSAFRGETPDEMYLGTGAGVPDRLAADHQAARARRLALNRAAQCPVCA
jgi:hypothetical protein